MLCFTPTGRSFPLIFILLISFSTSKAEYIREFFGSGAFFGIKLDFMKDYTVGALVSAFGGYLILAIVMAVINKITGLHHHLEEKEDN